MTDIALKSKQPKEEGQALVGDVAFHSTPLSLWGAAFIDLWPWRNPKQGFFHRIWWCTMSTQESDLPWRTAKKCCMIPMCTILFSSPLVLDVLSGQWAGCEITYKDEIISYYSALLVYTCTSNLPWDLISVGLSGSAGFPLGCSKALGERQCESEVFILWILWIFWQQGFKWLFLGASAGFVRSFFILVGLCWPLLPSPFPS